MKKIMLVSLLILIFFQLSGARQVLQLDSLPSKLSLLQGESFLLLGSDISKVISGNPDVLEIVVLSDSEIVLHGKAVGTSNLIVQGQDAYHFAQISVFPQQSWTPEQITSAIAVPTVRVSKRADAAVLEGTVESDAERIRAEQIARLYAPEVLNYLNVPTAAPEQVAIKVRIVEISQKSWERIGLILGADVSGSEGQPLVSLTSKGELELAAALQMLEARGEAKLISEPALLSIAGSTASFLAGGEMPIPVAVNQQVVVDWKTYGTKLSVSAKIEGDLIRVQLAPEVSSLDWSSGISIGGSTVPALSTRRAQTEVYLPSGGTAVIAGLGQQQSAVKKRKLPWLGDLPFIGQLFRYRAQEGVAGELAIFLTAWQADGLPEPTIHE